MKRLVSVVEATKVLGGVSPSTVWRKIRHGELAATRIGGRTLISTDELDAFIERSTVAAGQAEGVAA